MSRSHHALLKDLYQEDHYLREEALRSVQNGMDQLVNSKRLLQKVSVNEQEREDLGIATAELMIAGNALRAALETLRSHHLRNEAPWVGPDGGIQLILRNSLEFEENVNNFLRLIREVMQIRRESARR